MLRRTLYGPRRSTFRAWLATAMLRRDDGTGRPSAVPCVHGSAIGKLVRGEPLDELEELDLAAAVGVELLEGRVELLLRELLPVDAPGPVLVVGVELLLEVAEVVELDAHA